jgi:hypothetical protein
MKNLLALAALALITFVVAGWFLGWYSNFHVDVNTPKIKEDITKAEEKVKDFLIKKPSTGNPAPAPTPTPAPAKTPNSTRHVTIVPVTTPDGTFVLPGNPVNTENPSGPQILPPMTSVPPPLPSTPPPLPSTPPPLPSIPPLLPSTPPPLQPN